MLSAGGALEPPGAAPPANVHEPGDRCLEAPFAGQIRRTGPGVVVKPPAPGP